MTRYKVLSVSHVPGFSSCDHLGAEFVRLVEEECQGRTWCKAQTARAGAWACQIRVGNRLRKLTLDLGRGPWFGVLPEVRFVIGKVQS